MKGINNRQKPNSHINKTNERHKKMKLFRIDKTFQGGKDLYYVKLPKTPEKKQWPYILERIGENTNGGHNYGYRVDAHLSRKKEVPKELILKIPYLDFF